eukprot:112738-Pyramimonas_sp.AAC.2
MGSRYNLPINSCGAGGRHQDGGWRGGEEERYGAGARVQNGYGGGHGYHQRHQKPHRGYHRLRRHPRLDQP